MRPLPMRFQLRRVLKTGFSSRLRRLIPAAAVMVLVLLVCGPAARALDVDIGHAPVEVYFSPNNGATEAIVREIDRARSEILVQAYSFTSAPIAKALLKAHKRGVKVQAILDKSQKTQKFSSASFLTNSGIPTYIDDKHAIAHNKIIIIDKAVVITGSFNFTKAAEEKNAENLLIIRSKELAKPYLENWQRHREHSAA
ncbi:MAG: phospholipase D family protein [Deltaproteobacteria bacterium]|nr:phospholipase D family protein [Deltaproteobacteria bacterium]